MSTKYQPINSDDTQDDHQILNDDIEALSNGSSNGEKIKIEILDIQGKKNEILISTSSTVENAKQMIEEKTGIPVDRQRLIFQGSLLQNAHTIASCKLTNNSIVHLFPRSEKSLTEEPTESSTPSNHQITPSPTVIRQVVFSVNRVSYADDDIFRETRNERFWASCLMLISLIQMISILMYLLLGGEGENEKDESPNDNLQVSIILEMCWSSLGFVVGYIGLKGVQTLDPRLVRKYCVGMTILGLFTMSIRVYDLIEVILQNKLYHKHENGDNSNSESGNSNNTEPQSSPIEAIFSLIASSIIWGFCIFRTCKFNRIVQRFPHGVPLR